MPREQLYPRQRYPQGHPDLAASYNELGMLLRQQGEYARALPYLERAVAMYQEVYPAERFPRGQPDLGRALNNLATILHYQGEYDKALPYFERSLAQFRRLYPLAQFPQGHPYLAQMLNNLGGLQLGWRQLDKAQAYLEQALAMREQLYPRERFPNGHPSLAETLTFLGHLQSTRDAHAQALRYYQRALAMREQLYPGGGFPRGHPDLATSLQKVGAPLGAACARTTRQQRLCSVPWPCWKSSIRPRPSRRVISTSWVAWPAWASCIGRGDNARALPLVERALAMRGGSGSGTAHAGVGSRRAEFPAVFAAAAGRFLVAAAARRGRAGARLCPALAGQGAAHAAAAAATGPPTSPWPARPRRVKWQELLDTRHQLAGMLLAPDCGPGRPCPIDRPERETGARPGPAGSRPRRGRGQRPSRAGRPGGVAAQRGGLHRPVSLRPL